MAHNAIEIKNLTKVFQANAQPLTIFDNFSIDFEEGKITSIIGPSGCGKSTLLRLIVGLEKPTAGEIIFNSKKFRFGMIFQEKALFPWLTVEGNVAFGLELMGIPKTQQKQTIEYWLDKVGLFKFANYYPVELSGGMKQRLAFARCLAIKPDIVLMDEPFVSLDSNARSEIIDFAENILVNTNTTTLFVTHNLKEAIKLSEEIVFLDMTNNASYKVVPVNLDRPRTVKQISSKELEIINLLEIDEVI